MFLADIVTVGLCLSNKIAVCCKKKNSGFVIYDSL